MNLQIAVIASFSLCFGISAQAQWVQTGPYGGDISALAVVGTNLFATSNGFFCSSDNGKSWKLLPALPAGAVTFAVSGSNLFAGGDGIIISTDNGNSWTAIDSGLKGYDGFFNEITALATIGTTIFAGTADSGIFRSTNNGTNWVAVDSDLLATTWGPANVSVKAFAVIGTNIFVSIARDETFNGIFLSTDNGESWSETGWNESSFRYPPSVLTVMGSNLFAGGPSVYRSTDKGASWKDVKSGLRDTIVYALFAYGTNLFAGTQSGMFRSTDSGASWNEVSAGLPVYSYDLAFAQIGTSLFATSYNLGVFVSTDSGTSWKAASNGLLALSLTALVTDGTNLYAQQEDGAFGGISLSTDGGASWNLISSGLKDNGALAIAVSGSKLYAGTGNGLYLSTDHGTSWTMDTGLKTVTTIGNSTIYYDVSAFGVFGADLFAELYTGGLYHSTDEGTSWNSADSGLNERIVLSFAEIGSNLFTGTQGWGVYRSTDNGTSWTAAGLTDVGSINALAVSGTNLFAGTGNYLLNSGIFLSTDNGESWTSASTGLPTNTTVSALAVSGTNIFAGLDDGGGVFLSTNNGGSWASVGLDSVGAYAAGITGFAIVGSDLYAATATGSNEVGAGVWRRPLSDFGITASVAPPSATTQVVSVFPNPLSSSTTISFKPQTSGYADVSIVNLLGVEVARIFSGEVDAGEHRFTWDASEDACATAGIYECLVRMNGKVERLPVVLMGQ